MASIIIRMRRSDIVVIDAADLVAVSLVITVIVLMVGTAIDVFG